MRTRWSSVSILPIRPILTNWPTTLDVWEVQHSADPEQRYLVAQLWPDQLAALRQAGRRVVVDAAKTALLTPAVVDAAQQTAGIPGFACYRTVEETYTQFGKVGRRSPHAGRLDRHW